MRLLFLLRPLFRLVLIFNQELRAGNPYALGAAGLLVAAVVGFGIFRFARRPLGGDPEKPPISDDDFRDDANPYR